MPTSNPRQLALTILRSAEDGRHTLDRVLNRHDSRISALESRDRAFLHALVYGVMRWRLRLDWILGQFSRTPVARMHTDIRNILRMGVFQLQFMDRVPSSAAVNTSVDLARHVRQERLTGFVNGILRNIVRKGSGIALPDPSADIIDALSIRHAMPAWLVRRWTARFGRKNADALMEALNRVAPLTGRVNTLRATRRQVLERLRRDFQGARPTTFSPAGITIGHRSGPVSDLAVVGDGSLRIQDEAAQLVTLLLHPEPGQTVLDACAGRGGKTTHIAQCMEDRGSIMAVDADRSRLDQLAADLPHLGISSVTPVLADLHEPLPDAVRGPFDRILLDAPCSGLGVIRRNPDTKWNRAEKDLRQYARRQRTLLDALSPLVKPSGLLVYAVCSLEPEENEQVIQDFITNHPNFDLLHPARDGRIPADAGLVDSDGLLRTMPHLYDMDGFFAATLKRSR